MLVLLVLSFYETTQLFVVEGVEAEPLYCRVVHCFGVVMVMGLVGEDVVDVVDGC